MLVRLAVRAAEGLSDLRIKTFAHLHGLSVLHVEAERRGSLVSRVTSDIVAIQDFVDWGGVGLLIGTAQVVLAMAAMLVYQWKLALLVLGGVVVYAGLLVWFQRILQRLHDQVRRRVGDTLAALSEAISGLAVVRAYGGEDATLAKVEDVIDKELHTEVRTFTVGAGLFSSAEIFAGAITAAVILVGVLTGVAEGTSAGTLLAMLFLVNLLVEPVQTLVETLDQAQSAAAGVRRITEVLDTVVDVPDPVDGVALPSGALDVRFTNVRFRYPTGGDVLVDVSAHIPAGARVAVVGETGSGKSTFAKLVTRLLDPAEGEVSIGGVPLPRVRFSSLRNHVVFVPQEGFLFDASVADNVRYGKPQATDEEVAWAFTDLALDEWLGALPEGAASEVGERGGQVSAGERQLVAACEGVDRRSRGACARRGNVGRRPGPRGPDSARPRHAHGGAHIDHRRPPALDGGGQRLRTRVRPRAPRRTGNPRAADRPQRRLRRSPSRLDGRDDDLKAEGHPPAGGSRRMATGPSKNVRTVG